MGFLAGSLYDWTSLGLLASLWRFIRLWVHCFFAEMFGKAPFELSGRRVMIFLSIAVFAPLLLLWNHLGMWIDDQLFPLWKNARVKSPLFFIGNARSGTTWLHRLLTESDDKLFTTFRTWEILFAVPVVWKVLFYRIYLFDQRWLCGMTLKLLLLIETNLIGHVSLHPVGLMEAEEDEWLMMHVGLAQLLLFFFPSATDLANPLILFDFHPDMLADMQNGFEKDDIKKFHASLLKYDRRQMLSSELKLKIFAYYRDSVKRHMYFRCTLLSKILRQQEPSKLIFVSKNPSFTLRIPSLYSAFPDARVVCLIRDPLQAVPSMVSYIAHLWRAFSSPRDDFPSARLLLSFCLAHYLFPLFFLHDKVRPSERFHFISYHRLQVDLYLEIESLLLRCYGLTCSPDMAINLKHEQTLTNSYRTEHRYNLEECCGNLSEQELKSELAMVYRVHADLLPSQQLSHALSEQQIG